MSEQIISKRCTSCKQIKPVAEFYAMNRNKGQKSGYHCWCKICDKNKMIKYYQSPKGKVVKSQYERSENGKAARSRYQKSERGKIASIKSVKEYRKTKRDRYQAHYAITNAVRYGKLRRASDFTCSKCPNQASEWHHHEGYEPEHFLDVVPVCTACHNKIHCNQNSPSGS